MSINSNKVMCWNGKNKTLVRIHKIFSVKNFLETTFPFYYGDRRDKIKCLTFAGPDALFERLLVNQGITTAGSITTIQTTEKLSVVHNGEELLRKLIRTREEHLPFMKIWPHSFNSFSACYGKKTCIKPPGNKTSPWAKRPFVKYMNEITRLRPHKFELLDIDLCGIFNEANSSSFIRLFENGTVSRSGLAFLTHQKGRDVRGGKLFLLLENYLDKEAKDSEGIPLLSFDSIRKKYKKNPTDIARYELIPLYYICKLYNLGYMLSMDKLIEYRDRNKDSGLAVNMLQYFFSWVRLDLINNPRYVLKHNLESVMNEWYAYDCWVD